MAEWGLKLSPQLAGLLYLQFDRNDCDFTYMDLWIPVEFSMFRVRSGKPERVKKKRWGEND